ncbi:MAG TPA: DUF692 family protein [Myxococcaceae bacterium]|nr:DUF692 family protein [Myxococcaceae bacterium]
MEPRALPFLGLGLSSNLDPAVEPDPWALHAAEPGLLDLVEYSAPLPLQEAERDAGLFPTLMARRERLPVLFHPVHLNLAGPELEPAGRLAALEAHARAVGSPWVGNDVAWWHVGGTALPGYLYLPPPFSAAGLELAAAHALHVAAGLSVPLALENPVVVRRDGPLHVLDFMAALHARTGCPLVLDVGHLVAAQLASKLPLETGLDGFPFDAVIEVHVAGAVITRTTEGRGVYMDDHGQPLRSEVLGLLAEVLPRCRALRALVFEGDGHPAAVARRTLLTLRAMLEPIAERAALRVEPPRSRPPRLPDGAAALSWRTFDLVHGREPPEEDPPGVHAELGLRLSVTREALDARWPLSRPLLAPSRVALERFLASAAYRDAFAGGQRLDAAWAAWARSEMRGSGAPELATALAFDTWAQALAGAPGGRSGVFAADLGEALFALGALRRHLASRALGEGLVPEGALEGLAQAVRRAPGRPWRVHARWNRGRLEVGERGLDPTGTAEETSRPT